MTPDDGARAACAQVDADLWFSNKPTERAQAAAICQTCPTLAACFAEVEMLRTAPYNARSDDSHNFRPFGIWAGLSYDGRGGAGQPVREVKEHGAGAYTNKGCRCRVCTDDYARARRERRARDRGAA